MLVSTRGRYALHIMTDIAQNETDEYIVLMDISNRLGISEKYLENIVAALSRAGLLQAQRGRGGGYRLARRPAEYTVGDIVRAAEGDLNSVSCLKNGESDCPNAEACIALPVWQELDRRIDSFLDSVTLADVLQGVIPPEK